MNIIALCPFIITLTLISKSACQFPAHITEFYFVRHGQTDHNAGIITACLDLPLNQRGKEQAKSIEPIIAALPVKSVCYSPLLRARETKEIIAAQLEAIEHEIAHLTECALEDWPHIRDMRVCGLAPHHAAVHCFLEQIKTGLETALLKDGPVLIVAHGGVYCALCHLLHVDTLDHLIDNCVPVRFYWDDSCKRWKVEKIT